jgi:transcriptional regulator with XRE-family HTH domain
MKLSSETPLAIELRDPEVRQSTVESQIKIGVPFQLRAMRESREWTQEKLAEKLKTTQNTVSRLENPKTSRPTITTLLRIARAFDVGLLVRFVPFGFYGGVIEAMDSTHIEVPSYDQELATELAANPIEEKLGQVATAFDPQPEQESPRPLSELSPLARSSVFEVPRKGTGRFLGGAQSQLDQSIQVPA